MGAAGSVALNDPFPVDEKGRKDLNLLSHITARILATPDIYSIANLNRPGVCGDYAIFLKDKIMQQLLPFASEFDKKDINQKGTSKIYLYQNPLTALRDPVTQTQICAEIANSVIRLALTVVACLASIQYKEVIDRPAVEIIMTQPAGVQVGGGRRDVGAWFGNAGYSSTAAPGATIINLDTNASHPHFVLTSVGAVNNITNWIIQVPPASQTRWPEVTKGGFRVQIIDPIQIPGLPPDADTLLPIRIYDAARTFIVGVLQGKTLKILDAKEDSYFDFLTVLHHLFSRAAGNPGDLPENRLDKILYSYEIFKRGRNAILQILTPYLSRQTGFNPMMMGASPGGFVVPGPGGFAPGGFAPGGFAPGGFAPGGFAPGGFAPGGFAPGGFAGQGFAGQGFGGMPLPPQQQRRLAAAPTAAGGTAIPQSAVMAFDSVVKRFIDNSCPAAIRATTLAATIHKDRTVATNICVDEYWKKTKIDSIYPYATLQLLCYEDVTKLGTQDPRAMNQTWIDFVEALRQIFPVSPPGTKTQKIPSIEPTNAYFLNQIGFKMANKLDICASGPTVTVQYPAVQDALIKINQSYTAHIAKMWDILNSLVVVIEDPDTKKDLVRLNPALLTGSTKENIEVISKNAMKLIAIHYIEIEKIYTDAVKTVEPTTPFIKR